MHHAILYNQQLIFIKTDFYFFARVLYLGHFKLGGKSAVMVIMFGWFIVKECTVMNYTKCNFFYFRYDWWLVCDMILQWRTILATIKSDSFVFLLITKQKVQIGFYYRLGEKYFWMCVCLWCKPYSRCCITDNDV